MYTFSAEPPYILVQFPYAWLEDFKALVPKDDRQWHPDLKRWSVTIHGFNVLTERRAESVAPLPWDVLELAVPPRIDGPAKLRIAR
ncbi:MAG: hypothetical protein ACRC1H_13800 [Caldilineaceae bacterium]